MKQSNHKCPICRQLMLVKDGDFRSDDPKKGLLIYCTNAECDSMERVYGHGSRENEAYEVACEKFRLLK